VVSKTISLTYLAKSTIPGKWKILTMKIVAHEFFYSEDVQTVNTCRGWIIEQLGFLIRNGSIPKSDDWVQLVLSWFTLHGLFTVKKKSDKSPIKEVGCLHRLVL
jgi:hypothetical protein